MKPPTPEEISEARRLAKQILKQGKSPRKLALAKCFVNAYPVAPKSKVAKGQIVRYGDGPTALMRVRDSSQVQNEGGARHYTGRQFYGGHVGQWEFNIQEATKEEIADYLREEYEAIMRQKW